MAGWERRVQEELGDRKASGWKGLWALCPSGVGVGDPSLCWRAEPGCALPTMAGQAGSRGWGTHWLLLATSSGMCRAGRERRHSLVRVEPLINH